jgi:salicylate 5-hydroxylase small subunit
MTAEDVLDRFRVDALYADYLAALDQRRFADWPDFFTEQCLYRLVPRENFERALPLSTLFFESRGMLRDRVYAITQTLYHDPYYQRHLVSGLKVAREGDSLVCEANYLVVRTKPNDRSDLFQAGRYFDRVVERDGRLLFAEKICVFDSEIIPNSLIYPI